MNLQNFNLAEWIETMLIFIVAITIHEFAHALATDRSGDDTPRMQGRLTLNPVDHLDPLGTVLMALSAAFGIGIGWGRPVQYNPSALKHPRWDQVTIALWGPISNVLQALFCAVLVRLDDKTHWLGSHDNAFHLLNLAVYLNLTLAVFNLIPVPPLDGSKILSGILPLDHAKRYESGMGQWGFFLFMILAFTGATAYLIGPPVDWLYRVLVG